jgi:hypothetical protein
MTSNKKKEAAAKPPVEPDPERKVANLINRQTMSWERYCVTDSLEDLASYIEAGGDIDPQEASDGPVFNDVRTTIVSVLRGKHKPPSKGRKDWGALEFYLDVISARKALDKNTLAKVHENTALGKGIGWEGFEKRYKRGLKIARTLGLDKSRGPAKSGQ